MARDQEMQLSVCSSEACAFVATYGSTVVEIGAGEGDWARALRASGLDVRAFDIVPRGEGVELGDHNDAAKCDGLMLAVWPPNDSYLLDWLEAKPWPLAITCGDPIRFGAHRGLPNYREIGRLGLPDGPKGENTLSAWERV